MILTLQQAFGSSCVVGSLHPSGEDVKPEAADVEAEPVIEASQLSFLRIPLPEYCELEET